MLIKLIFKQLIVRHLVKNVYKIVNKYENIVHYLKKKYLVCTYQIKKLIIL